MARRNDASPEKPSRPRLYPTHEAAAKLGIGSTTLYRWLQSGCPTRKRGGRHMIDLDKVMAWAKERNLGGPAGGRTLADRMRASVADRKLGDDGKTSSPSSTPAAILATSSALELAAGAFASAPVDDLGLASLHEAIATRALTDAERLYLSDVVALTKQRKEAAEADKRELMNAQRRGELVERSRVIECWEMVAGEFRRATETLQRQFGRDAFEVIDAALDRSAAALARAIAVRGGAVDDSGGEGGEPAEGVEPVEEGIEA